jgi:hypothetical protein
VVEAQRRSKTPIKVIDLIDLVVKEAIEQQERKQNTESQDSSLLSHSNNSFLMDQSFRSSASIQAKRRSIHKESVTLPITNNRPTAKGKHIELVADELLSIE